jgi:hypothetical protein
MKSGNWNLNLAAANKKTKLAEHHSKQYCWKCDTDPSMVQKKPIQIHAAMQQQTIKRGDRHTMQARTKNDLQNLHAICCFPKTSKCAAEIQPR